MFSPFILNKVYFTFYKHLAEKPENQLYCLSLILWNEIFFRKMGLSFWNNSVSYNSSKRELYSKKIFPKVFPYHFFSTNSTIIAKNFEASI